MASLGWAVTNQFLLGSFDVRVSDFSQAGTLTSAHSVGLVDGVTLSFELTQADVLNGTSSLIDRNVIRQLATIQFTFREFSDRNWRMALGQSIEGLVGSVNVTELRAVSDSLLLPESTLVLKPGDKVVTNMGKTTTIKEVTSFGVFHVPSLVLNDSLAIGTKSITVYRTDDTLTSTPAGKTPYQTLQLVQQDRTTDGSYLVWDFWKVTIDGGFEAAINHTDFASASLRFKTFDVTTDDVVPDIVKQFPVFRYYKATTI